MKKILLAAFFLLLLGRSARATPLPTAGELAEKCKIVQKMLDNKTLVEQSLGLVSADPYEAHDEGYCAGYIAAWMAMVPAEMEEPKWEKNVTVEEVLRVFLKYMHEHPEQEHLQAVVVLTKTALEMKLLHERGAR